MRKHEMEIRQDATPDLLTDVEYEWATVADNPDYLVHESGVIYDTSRGREVKQNFSDAFVVNLRSSDSASGQTTRRVAQLVAEAFVPREFDRFNTVIFLDGDRRNHHADNLAWRTRAYAIRYHNDINNPEYYNSSSLVFTESGEIYENLVDAGISTGICLSYIRKSIVLEQAEMLFGIKFYDSTLRGV